VLKDDKNLIDMRFPKGKNNVSHETDLPDNAARELLNVDLTNSGHPSRRKGYTSVYASGGETIHSLFSTKNLTVFMQGQSLKQLHPDFSATNIRTGLDPDNPISYAEVNELIYFSNGDDTGVIDSDGTHAEWGVDAPLGQPLAIQIPGSLDAGTYQIAVTYLNILGEESGSIRATTITVPVGGGITLTNIPQSTAASINIYVTAANGDQLYWQANIPMGETTYSLTSLNRGRLLETQFLERMPPGQIVRYGHGRMWVAVDDLLIFSPALRYGLFDPRFTYFRFPKTIDIVQPIEDGIYVIADKTYFLAGTDPMEMKQEVVYPYPGVRGTGMAVPHSKFVAENDLISDSAKEDVAFWYSTHGAVVGYPRGNIHPLTEDRVAIAEYGKGASLLREEDGIRQLVTSLTDKGDDNGFGVTDYATAEVRRNGVLIN
jgi:hypothetical protein